MFFYVIIFCVGAGITTLMYLCDGLDPHFFRQKVETKLSMNEERDGEVFISRQSWHFSFIDNMTIVLFPICTLIRRVNNYVSRQGKGINRGNKVLLLLYKL